MKKLLVFDAYNFLFRAYYALPPLESPEGMPISAVYGFLKMVFRYITKETPEYVLIACDSGDASFRKEIFPQYKGNRPEILDDLVPQFSILRESLECCNLPYIEYSGYEADDIIATAVDKFRDTQIIVFSSDKDLSQLLSYKHISIFDPLKNTYISEESLFKKYGVFSDKLIDVMSLAGDTSDNIPGIPGIGYKTAALLVNSYGDLDGILKNASSIPQKKRRENIETFAENALIARQLISLSIQVPIQQNLADLVYNRPEYSTISGFINKYGMFSLSSYLQDRHLINEDPISTYSLVSCDELKKHVLFSGYLTILVSTEHIVCGTLQYAHNLEYSKVDQISDLITSESILKITFDINHLYKLYNKCRSVFDILTAAYSINTNKHTMSNLVNHYLQRALPQDVVNQGLLLFEMFRKIQSSMYKAKVMTLYENIDKPLSHYIHQMELKGVKVNATILHDLENQINTEIQSLEQEIYKIIGYQFSISSNQQLSDALFTHMKLPKSRKLKSGFYSTDSYSLEILYEQGFQVCGILLEWKKLYKILTTYTTSLIKYINPDSSRIHTSYSTTSTSTGRMSSTNPNLQNIPRTSMVRKAFIAEKNHKLLSVDYSQIEIRILAYIADIPELKEALYAGEDIHTITAQKIFSAKHITTEMRQKAKTINFGIIYGITPFGLAKRLNISIERATCYIREYLEKYPNIQKYMTDTKEYAKKNGFIKTIFGRKCYIENINSHKVPLRNFAERVAINAPLQGSAADILRNAIVQIGRHKEICNTMIMQIHDELVFEVPIQAVDSYIIKIRSIMEQAFPDIPLQVDFKIGDNLLEMHE
ncbi:MAG: DNA polymerase I [Candidatus Xenolissoclinum pacificiensis L6]|uniref:DNA polymerase I n=1 Tax=Candidatus Xenolissoclinum pacificiensis L6 TaxID=1401685 RepID=W2V0B9_9RICK|nr:MAG: DNA polymerase I [Candidatus Xenolissoclinum pacificiensis L6]